MGDAGRGHGAATEMGWANLPPETVLQRWLDALSAAIPFGSGTERPRDDDEPAYDLGDCWRHEITCQRILAGGPGTAYPVCTAGQGKSPVEDSAPRRWRRALPTGPSLTRDANKRLAQLFSPS